MLVLNTNEQNKGNRVSNQMLWQYPDFRQILMKPVVTIWEGLIDISNAPGVVKKIITPETYWTIVYSVNWTAINFWCHKLLEDKIYESIQWTNSFLKLYKGYISIYWGGYSAWKLYQTSWTNTSKLRIGLNDSPLLWGEIVWKKIKMSSILSINRNISWNNWVKISDLVQNFSFSYSWSMEIWLLRKNGTIEKIWTLPLYNEQVSSSDDWIKKIEKQFFMEKNFNWVTAEEWDIIIVDLLSDYNLSFSWQTSTRSEYKTIQLDVALWFWTNGSTQTRIKSDWGDAFSQNIAPLPIQISIE